MTSTVVRAADPAPERTSARPAPVTDSREHYRAHLDGLRAIAVYLVVAFHAGLTRFRGGFIGVDVFFVLSGYLVTELLLRDVRGRGGIRFGRFYSRRIRRLLPAAIVTLVVTAIVYAAVASPAEALDARGAFQSALLYVSNWYFIHQATDYFASDINASPVLHFWSLSIEEQFYFVWPLLLWGLASFAGRFRNRWTIVQVTVAVLGLLSLGAALRLATSNPNLAYFGTFSRAYQLLAGALLALTPGLVRRIAGRESVARALPFVALAALAALIALGTSLFDVGPITRGAFVAVVTCILLVAIEGRRGLVRSGLSTSPLVYLGRISYGTYLWHWPIIVIAAREFSLAPLPMFGVAVLLATGLASLSFQILEHPIRASAVLDNWRRPVIVVGLATSVLTAALIIPNLLERDHGSTVTAVGSNAASTGAISPASLDWRAAKKDVGDMPDCLNKPLTACTVVHGTGAHILLMGDSHAQMLIPTFETLAKKDSLTLSVAAYPQCPWLDELYYGLGANTCQPRRDDWFNRFLPKLKPDVVVLVERALGGVNAKQGDGAFFRITSNEHSILRANTREFIPTVLHSAQKTLDKIHAVGAKALIVEPFPVSPPDFNQLSCISGAKTLDACRFVVQTGLTPAERAMRGLDDGARVQSVDADKWLCPYLPICDPVVNGMIVRRDESDHITATFARSLAPKFEATMVADGMIKPSTR